MKAHTLFKYLMLTCLFYAGKTRAQITPLVIGSEHDVYLGTNATLWAQYTNFYQAVTLYAKTLWPGLQVATELTFQGITTQNAFAQALNANSDCIGIS